MRDDEHEGTVWRIVRAIHLRLIGHHIGRDLFVLSHPEQEQPLDRWHRYMERDVQQLMAVVQHARTEAIGRTHRRLHAAEGIDHEMLDEAIEYAHVEEP